MVSNWPMIYPPWNKKRVYTLKLEGTRTHLPVVVKSYGYNHHVLQRSDPSFCWWMQLYTPQQRNRWIHSPKSSMRTLLYTHDGPCKRNFPAAKNYGEILAYAVSSSKKYKLWLMEEIRLTSGYVVYPIIYRVSLHPRWLFGISSIN